MLASETVACSPFCSHVIAGTMFCVAGEKDSADVFLLSANIVLHFEKEFAGRFGMRYGEGPQGLNESEKVWYQMTHTATPGACQETSATVWAGMNEWAWVSRIWRVRDLITALTPTTPLQLSGPPGSCKRVLFSWPSCWFLCSRQSVLGALF